MLTIKQLMDACGSDTEAMLDVINDQANMDDMREASRCFRAYILNRSNERVLEVSKLCLSSRSLKGAVAQLAQEAGVGLYEVRSVSLNLRK